MLSPKTRRKIFRILPFGIIWLLFSLVYVLLERGLLGNMANYPSTGNPYSFARNIFLTPIAALIAGLLIGTLEISYFNRLFSPKSFTKKVLLKSAMYLGIIISFILILTVIANAIELQRSILDKQVWENVLALFFGYAFLSVGVYMALVILASQFYAEVSDNLGLPVLSNFLTGKYHAPREEERIFMFVDMRSSSAIAENPGHVKYFDMLREYYFDLSDAIIRYSGEVYQYVGDEIVVTWKLKNGIKNNNCIECFYAMKAEIERQTRKYKMKFGLVPDFKAGFHFGKVTTGEIGEIKKEIIFTGDTLNATSRIQGLCNNFHVDILMSGELISKLNFNSGYMIKSMGDNELKGKEEKLELFTIERKASHG